MQVLILCGGRGIRLNGDRPKPLIEIAGRPIVWHVMSIYARQGFDRFMLLTGYRSDAIARYVADTEWPGTVECVDTGADTPTGGRVHAVRDRIEDQFCLTYADGLANVDIASVIDRIDETRALAAMTVVRPELPFGVASIEKGLVTGFREKPRSEHWVNGGFFVFEPAVLDYLGPDSVLERGPLERLAAEGALAAYRHTGFWRCLDTAKDAAALEEAGPSAWLA
jgi:glucose-1-phosphate cytidylyltransferase